MLCFDVEVRNQSVRITEVEKLNRYHAKAHVNSVIYVYNIHKGKLSKPKDKGWYSRGLNTVFWHAKNSGNNVTFEPVYNKVSGRKKRFHDKQKEMF